MDSLSFWDDAAKSSPPIVLILLGVIMLGARLGHFFFRELLARLDAKDMEVKASVAENRELQRQTLTVLRDHTEVSRELVKACERIEQHAVGARRQQAP